MHALMPSYPSFSMSTIFPRGTSRNRDDHLVATSIIICLKPSNHQLLQSEVVRQLNGPNFRQIVPRLQQSELSVALVGRARTGGMNSDRHLLCRYYLQYLPELYPCRLLACFVPQIRSAQFESGGTFVDRMF